MGKFPRETCNVKKDVGEDSLIGCPKIFDKEVAGERRDEGCGEILGVRR